MKKPAILTVIFFFFLLITARAQEFGYKTIDAGGEFLGRPHGYSAALHIAYNFPVHHALNLRVGYNKINSNTDGKHAAEEGSGPGFSLGYRYYFPVRPRGFFLGIRADVLRLKIAWSQALFEGTSKIWALQPTAEMGYMILINDLFFITPFVSAGVQTNIKTEGQAVGDGFVPQFGLSTGWKF